MRFQWLEWKHSLWGKASPGQWRFTLRNSFSMCLALTLAYELNLDEPYWAMTSAAVVSFPTVGGVVSKSLGRILGSLSGAFAALILAGNTLNDPWFFSFVMAGWLGLCTWASSQFQNNAAYAFQLAGYTTALIAFPMINSPDISQLWELAQARVSEVIIGILCSGLMMLIIPGNSDARLLLNALQTMHTRLLEHARLLWRPETSAAIHTAHHKIITEILTMNLLRIQAFWSHHRLRRHNALLNYLLHQQLRLISSISGIRRLLLNWPDPPEKLPEHLNALFTELERDTPCKYKLARYLGHIAAINPADYRHLAFWQRLRSFCWQYINNKRWIKHLWQISPVTRSMAFRTPPLTQFTDNAEALLNGLRTFSVILVLCAFSINTQWQAGDGALTLAAIGCALFSSLPAPQSSLNMLMRVLVLLALLSFVVKFALMIQLNDLWLFLLIFLLPFTITLQLIRIQQPALAGIARQILVFMGSFIAVNNIPVYDFASFMNGNLSKAVGVAVAWLAYSVLRPSSDARKGRRHIRALRRGFMDQLSRQPAMNEHQFESLTYHHISQLNSAKDELAHRWLLRWGVVLLNCSHVVWQLRDWQARSDPLSQVRDVCIGLLRDVMSSRGVQQKPLAVTLQQLQHICTALSRHHNPAAKELAALIWRLFCSLSQLEQFPLPGHSVADSKNDKTDSLIKTSVPPIQR